MNENTKKSTKKYTIQDFWSHLLGEKKYEQTHTKYKQHNADCKKKKKKKKKKAQRQQCVAPVQRENCMGLLKKYFPSGRQRGRRGGGG